ncbi:fungal-specific transcription factor domain-containing protein [Chaetomium tenue]|uniref:Fungal-specific transcription factor domain-containing protein n=1 Tax=Chaetomium tenue TaxID=1854479 RepID=A0ACB7NX23_9PEZI|nr:fungal-specific transcription factor domain-containing protein [Chaetomium globosum]
MPPLLFLHRAWRKIAVAQSLGMSNQPVVTDQLVLLSGDMPINPSEPHKFPETPAVWRRMQDNFAIGWTETFHFLHRPSARLWQDTVYRNWVEEVPLESHIGQAKAAVALMTMALGTMFNYRRWRLARKEISQNWLWTVNNGDNLFLITFDLTGSEPGPPKLESVQARLLQTLYLLCTCRLSQACYVFGNAIQMLTCLGLHRRRGRNRGLGPEIVVHPEYAKIQCERRTFWSAYIIDKHIAAITGQPPHLSIDMTDQALPDCVNDEDMGQAGPLRPHKNDCYMEALLEQAKLGKLVEKIKRQVYTLDDVPEAERLESALRLGKAVDELRAQLPPLMAAVKPSLLHFTWRCQQNLMQLAHFHAQMLVYRPFLTTAYPTDREKQQTTDFAIRTCIEAARATLTIAVNLAREQAERDKSHFHTLLHPHHLTYIAASILFLVPYVRDRQRASGSRTHPNYRPETDAKLAELANKAVKALVQGTNQYSPARRWAVILEELQEEVARQLSQDRAPSNEQTNETRGGDLDALDEQLLEDALRAHWEADIAREAAGDQPVNNGTPASPAPALVTRLWDKWKTTDWLDFDSAVGDVAFALDIKLTLLLRPLARFPPLRMATSLSLPNPKLPACRRHAPKHNIQPLVMYLITIRQLEPWGCCAVLSARTSTLHPTV